MAYGDETQVTYSYPSKHGPSGGSEFGKASSPRKLLGKQPRSRYIQSRLLGRPPRPNKPSATGWSAAVCRRHLRVRVFGSNRDRLHLQQSILRDSVEADSGQNFDDGTISPRWPSKKHKNLEHSACKWQRLQNCGNDCENRERHRAAGKKAVEKALPGEGGVRMFCSENRRVGGRDRPSAGAPTNAGQTSGKSRRQHVQNRLYPGLL